MAYNTRGLEQEAAERAYKTMTAVQAEPSTESPRIEQVVGSLDTSISQLDELLDTLRSRLIPVLEPDRSVNTAETKGMAEVEPSPLVAILRQQCSRLVELQLTVGNILDRLDL